MRAARLQASPVAGKPHIRPKASLSGSRYRRIFSAAPWSNFLNSIKFASVLLVALLATTVASAAVPPWMSLEEITGQAEVIVLGTVVSAESAWSADGRIIVTRTTVSVERPLLGGPRARVIVETPGGRVGDQTMVASGAPVFRSGERVVLFLEPAGEQRPGPAGGSGAHGSPGGGGPDAGGGWEPGGVGGRRR